MTPVKNSNKSNHKVYASDIPLISDSECCRKHLDNKHTGIHLTFKNMLSYYILSLDISCSSEFTVVASQIRQCVQTNIGIPAYFSCRMEVIIII